MILQGRKMKHIKLRWLIISIILDFMFLTIFPFNALATEEYVFERMWPTLQQPWYFVYPSDIESDSSGNVYVIDDDYGRIQKFTSSGEFLTKWGKRGAGNGEFDSARGLAIDGNGNIYVADSGNDRIQKFTSSGKFLTKWGTEGYGDGQFKYPNGVAVDSSGNVYVVDGYNHRIQKFTSSGEFLTKWGSEGSGDGQFSYPKSIAVDSSGNVFVADWHHDRIQKFSSSGEFILKWGTNGTGDGEFDQPWYIDIDNLGNVYIVDRGNHRIQKFTSSGKFLTKWGTEGSGDGEFTLPSGLTINSSGNIYVADVHNYCIQKFTSSGEFLTKWGSKNSGDGEFDSPWHIYIDNSGNVYIADVGNHRIQKFTSSGKFLTKWGSYGAGDGEFDNPNGVAVDSVGNVYVADGGNDRIQKFTSSGKFLTKWGTEGSGDGQFRSPNDIAVDSSGNVYVADSGNDRIQKFTSSGKFLTKWGSKGSGDGQFESPKGVAVDSSGNVFVADFVNSRVQKFSSSGEFMAKWGDCCFGDGKIFFAADVATDPWGNVYVADLSNFRIQKFGPNGLFIAKFGVFGSDPGSFHAPFGVAVDQTGKIYVVDCFNNRIQVFKEVTTGSNNKAIILAGGGAYSGNNLWDSTQMCVNFAYRTLTYQGFTKKSIHYLTSNTNLDLDNNGVLDDVDGDATNSNLQKAITEWAKDADSVLLYLTDHGGNGTFRMSGTETLSAAALDTWLDTLQTTMPGKVTVVYDACESGSFLPALTPPAGKERIVMTSTGPDETAKFVTQGSISFSSYFWTHIFNGVNILDAFELTTEALSISFNDQHPLVDANGNGVGNETEDYALISNLYIGNGTEIYGDAPVIGSVSEDQTITDTTSALLSASGVTDDDGIARVWAVIRPPDYGQGTSKNPVTELPSVDLMPVDGDRYEGEYKNFNIAGTYQIAIYAMDGNTNTSIPKLTTVSVENPLRRKAIIAIGSSQTDTFWPVVKESASLAYKALTYQGYANDDIYFMSPVAFSTGHDASSTLSNLSYAINTWCMEDTQDIVLYLVGNGDSGTFEINDTETLSATDLDSWLDALQETIPGKVTVIYDACLSGSFLPLLSPPTDKKRILISSASNSQPASFVATGNISFSTFFWSRVLNGANIKDSFLHGKDAMTFSGAEQIPQLDDTGNGVGNEKADGTLAKKTTIGAGIMLAADDPIIASVSPAQTLAGETSATLWAKDVTSTGTIDKVWAVITPPDYSSGSSANPVTDLPTIDLASVGNNRYEGAYANFTSDGIYNIAIFATDSKGTLSLPVQTTVAVTGACLSVAGDLSISVPCAEYNGTRYGFTLEFYSNPDDRSGYYWNLDMATLTGGTGTDIISISGDLSMSIPCVSYNGTQYGFTLDFYKNTYDPSGYYWKMDKGTLVVK